MAIEDDTIVQPPRPTNPTEFVKTYGPVAEQVSKEINVDPTVLLGKWGMETGWGKSIIGEHNLGNIKDPSGQGTKAVDKKEKSNDAYLAFETPQDFGRYYSDFIQRGYPEALNAGADIPKFTSGLARGVNGSYFGKTAPEEYQKALTGGYETASKIYGPSAETTASDVGGDTKRETPPEMMPVPFQHVTQQEGATTAGLGASAGFALDMPAELLRLGKYGVDLLRNPNSPASLQRYANGMIGDRNLNIPLKELEKLTGQRATNQSEVQDIVKTIKGGQPTHPENVTIQRGYGPTARQVELPVVNGQYIENGITKPAPLTGFTPPIDISKYETRPGIYYRSALPVLQGAGRAAGTAAGGALAAVQAQDALKRFQSGDKTGAGISAVGAGGSGLSTLGMMARMPKTGAAGAALSAGSMGVNLARDLYNATPEERKAMMEKLKGLPAALFSPTEESSTPSQESSMLSDFRRRYTPPSKRTTTE